MKDGSRLRRPYFRASYSLALSSVDCKVDCIYTESRTDLQPRGESFALLVRQRKSYQLTASVFVDEKVILVPRPLPLRERRPGTHCVRMRQIYGHFFSKIHRIH